MNSSFITSGLVSKLNDNHNMGKLNLLYRIKMFIAMSISPDFDNELWRALLKTNACDFTQIKLPSTNSFTDRFMAVLLL